MAANSFSFIGVSIRYANINDNNVNGGINTKGYALPQEGQPGSRASIVSAGASVDLVYEDAYGSDINNDKISYIDYSKVSAGMDGQVEDVPIQANGYAYALCALPEQPTLPPGMMSNTHGVDEQDNSDDDTFTADGPISTPQ